MSLRDWLEIGFHASLLLFVPSYALAFLLDHRWARIALAVLVIGALVYHIAVVRDCQSYMQGRSEGYLCRW